MRSHWSEIYQPVVVIQGNKDKLVHPRNADFLAEKLVNAPIKIIRKPKQGHFVLFENKDMIIAEIIKLLQ